MRTAGERGSFNRSPGSGGGRDRLPAAHRAGRLCFPVLFPILLPGTVFCGFLTGQPAWPGAQGEADAANAVSRQMQQGMRAMATGDFNAAVAAYTTVVEAQPNLAEGYFNLGLALEQAQKLDAARAALEKALRLKPALHGANLFLGITEYRMNRFAEAEAALERETRIDPRSAKAWMWLGVCRLAGGDARAAIPPLDKAMALDPKDVDILYHRGRAYLLEANASYDAMYKLDSHSVRVHQVLGEAFAKAYNTSSAIAEFALAVKAAPHQPGVHEELADQEWIAGQIDEAVAAYRAELMIDPHAATALYKLGSLLVEHDRAAEGVDLLAGALREDPSLTDAHYYLAGGLSALDRNGEAIREYQAAIAADPQNDRAISAYYKLAQVYRRLHQTAEAQEALANFQRLKRTQQEHWQQRTTQRAQQRDALPVEDAERAALSGAIDPAIKQ